jgi:glucose dehydrogenase
MNVKMYAGPGGHRGEFSAWEPVAGKKVWSIEENFPAWSGALVTGGDVVFYGTMDGWFKAVRARTGELLWQFKTSSGIIGQPITYRGPDGTESPATSETRDSSQGMSWRCGPVCSCHPSPGS